MDDIMVNNSKSDTVAIRVLEERVATYREKIQAMEDQKRQLEIDIPMAKSRLEALIVALKDIQGELAEQDITLTVEPIHTTATFGRSLRKGSATDVARLVLEEVGTSLAPSELFERVLERRPNTKKDSLMSGIYGLVRRGSTFKLDSGRIGLLELEHK